MGFDLALIGSILKEKRESLGLAVEDVSSALNLRKIMVRAIEEGRWDLLPHKVYVKGYVKEYGRLLGIPEQILPLLVEEEPPKEEVAPKQESSRPEVRRRLPRSFLIYGIALVLLAVFFFMERGRRNGVVQPELDKAHQLPVENVAGARQNPTELIADKKLMITCHERTWISIVIDGREKRELMLSPEEVVLLNAKERFDLLVGNAGGIKIFFNGKDTGFSGESKEVKRITLS